jgi:hypothetical protein
MTQIFIVSGTSWAVPSDWSSTNTIETIGGGGGGSGGGSQPSTGGGGGGYSAVSNLAGLSGSLTVQIGSGGSSASAGGDSWFNGASLATSSVGAKGGAGGPTSASGGAGGPASGGVGTTKFPGGDGGGVNAAHNGGGGGGGAAGPNGAGQAGGTTAAGTAGEGGGGGGGAGGGSSTPGAANTATAGGNGGNAQDGTAGGAGGTSASTSGGNGSHGSGGGGGFRNPPGNQFGGTGGNGIEWDPSHGAGGGGGGAGENFAGGIGTGGNGGNYGGGGGGGGYFNGTSGTGAQGIIVITYTPASAATVTADAASPAGFSASQTTPGAIRFEFPATSRSDPPSPCETVGAVRSDPRVATEMPAANGTGSRLTFGLLTTALADPSIQIATTTILGSPPVLPVELGAGLGGEASTRVEWLGATVVSLGADALLPIEWSALSHPVLLSLGASSKRRLLVAPGRLRLLKRV